MPGESPYHLIAALGSCQVGVVWSARDAHGGALTVAILNATVASDQRWRDAFVAAVNSLAQQETNGLRVAHSDFSAPAPWVACLADGGPGAERVFLALGMDYQPVPADWGASEASAARQSEVLAAEPGGAGQDRPVDADEATEADREAAQQADIAPMAVTDREIAVSTKEMSSPPEPVSALPPVSVPPASGAPDPAPGASDPFALDPLSPMGPSPYKPYFPSNSGATLAKRRRRTRLWIAAAVVAVLVLGGAGTVFAWQGLGATEGPKQATASGAASAPMPTTSPLRPGLEPPRPGDWPNRWPKLSGADKVKTVDLDGLGFPVTLPAAWNCVRVGSAAGFAKFKCGVTLAGNVEVGGELVVRDCPAPCNQQRRDAMRKTEEAWGQQWRAAGEYVYLAETLNLDGGPRYGLVMLAYWRSSPDGAVDRQLVLRMTAPAEWVDDIRKVANGIRDKVTV